MTKNANTDQNNFAYINSREEINKNKYFFEAN